jgi:ribose-phosphate pyrophosphokinase
MPNQLKVFSGSAHPSLTAAICRSLRIRPGKLKLRRFVDGEIWVKIEENVRGTDFFVVQPTIPPADNLLELLLIIDAALRASAKRITAVIPYFGYARQDRKDQPRVPISAKLVANLLTHAGAGRVLTMDLHAEPIQGFFDIPVDHLYAAPVVIRHFRKMGLRNCVVVSPDTGGVPRARGFARRMHGLPLAFIDKRRLAPNRVDEVMHVVGNVRRKNAIIVDDIIDTAGTIVKVAKKLREEGAHDVYASVTHAVLSGNAVDLIRESPIKEVIVTDTLPLPLHKQDPKIHVLTVAPLLARVIQNIHRERTVSRFFV